MTPAELRILIQEGKGTTLEFKENLSAAFARELVGMAKTIGGRILLGVRDDGTVAGVKDTNNEPVFEETGFVTATFFPNPVVRAQAGSNSAPGRHKVAGEVAAHDEAHDEAHEPISGIEHRLLSACADEARSTPDLLGVLGYRIRTANFKIALRQILTRGFLVMTIPDKSRSRMQRYRITPLGLEVLKKTKEKKYMEKIDITRADLVRGPASRPAGFRNTG